MPGDGLAHDQLVVYVGAGDDRSLRAELELSVYRDANHGFLFQEPVVFAEEVLAFLGE